MNRRMSDNNHGIMVGVNTWLFGVGALLVGYNAYFGIYKELDSSTGLLGGLTAHHAMMLSSFAIMMAGFFYSLVILKPDLIKHNLERKLMALKIKASQHDDFSDKTTGLHNKGYFLQVTKSYLDECNALDQTLGMLVIQVAGPRDMHVDSMRGVAKCLQRNARDYDVVARIGFDTIAVLTPHILKQDLAAISLRYQTVLAKEPDIPFMVDCKIGYSHNEKKSDSPERILQAAEQSLQVHRRLPGLKAAA